MSGDEKTLVRGDSEKARHPCNTCSVETAHDVLHQDENRWNAVIPYQSGAREVWNSEWYETIKCRGCGSISMFVTTQSEYGYEAEQYFPPRTFRRKPAWLNNLPREDYLERGYVAELIDEIYVALQNGSLRLAVMGIRAVLEAVMVDKVGDHGTFKRNIEKFETEGYISAKQRELLNATIEAGHAVTHRKHSPSQDQVVLVMDLAESIIKMVLVDPKQADRLDEATPKRR